MLGDRALGDFGALGGLSMISIATRKMRSCVSVMVLGASSSLMPPS